MRLSDFQVAPLTPLARSALAEGAFPQRSRSGRFDPQRNTDTKKARLTPHRSQLEFPRTRMICRGRELLLGACNELAESASVKNLWRSFCIQRMLN
jgi:hypothetical protein